MAAADPVQQFVLEARDALARMTSAVMALERGAPDFAAQLDELLRATHSVKGGAGFSGLTTIAQLAHALESAVENLRGVNTAPPAEVIDHLLFAMDRLAALIDDAAHSAGADISEPLARLRLVGAAETPAAPLAQWSASGAPLLPARAAPGEFPLSERVLEAGRQAAFLYGVKLDWWACERNFGLPPLALAARLEQAGRVLDSRFELSGPALQAGLPQPPLWYWAIVATSLALEEFAALLPGAAVVRLTYAPVAGPAPHVATPPRPPAGPGAVRIPVALVDRMMGLAGELVLVRNEALHAADADDRPARPLFRRLDAITNELQDAALRMRMQPVGTLFDRFPRLVRDLARQLGKQIELADTGAEVELDKTVLELLADPLTHLVRNSCDHGIEPPDERLRAGKAAAGRIQLAARQERGQILVEIRDDGRGLNRAAIARKALQQGMKRPAELERLSERQLYELILLPGFSTAEHVTDLSGRGVGMDVVRSNLEQLGGGIEIGSTAGQGTVFTLRLPLTLAIMPCLVLRSGAQRFVLPQRETEEIVRLSEGPGHSIERSHDEELLRLRGWLLPVLRLRNVLQSAAAVEAGPVGGACAPDGPGAGYVVVLRVGSQRFGLVVDEVLGGGDIVVKSLHPLLRSLGIYSGATILGDGTVALILSGEGLARLGGISARAAVESAEPAGDARLQHTLLLFRCGEAELLAAPLSAVRRVVRIASERIERVGARELVNVDGAAINVLRLDQFLDVSPCPARPWLYLVLPRNSAAPVGLLASEIVDTPTVAVDFDEQAYRADGVLGTAMLRGQIALFVDLDRICALWQTGRDPAPALPDPVRRKILVVEDTQFFRRLIASCLESAGYEVVTARDGHEAVAQLADGAFDLVVSDIEMPVMDGLALARHVRQVARTALPLLALTSLAGEADRNRLLAAGFDAHEVKFDRERFLRAVEELLARGGPAAAGPEGAPHA